MKDGLKVGLPVGGLNPKLDFPVPVWVPQRVRRPFCGAPPQQAPEDAERQEYELQDGPGEQDRHHREDCQNGVEHGVAPAVASIAGRCRVRDCVSRESGDMGDMP